MKRKIIALTWLLLLVQCCYGWNHPHSCGDGSEENPPTSSPPSPSTPTSMSGSSSSGGSSSACDCSLNSPLVSASGSATEGATSDFAQQLYDRYQAGEEIDQLELKGVPEPVQARLEYYRQVFQDLPGLMQRAVLWDSGFVVTQDNQAVQVWTLGGSTMAGIAVAVSEFEATGCQTLSCTESSGDEVQYLTCSRGPVQMLSASKCVVEEFESDNSSNNGASGSSSIPDIRVVTNSGTTECGCEYTIYSIQTATSNEKSTTGECPAGDWTGSLVIPCYGNTSVPDSVKAQMTPPNGSDWVTGWIMEHGKSSTTSESSGKSSASATTESGKESGGGFSLWWLLLILLIILLLIIAAIVACKHCHRLSRFHSPPDNTTYIFVGGRMWAVEDESPSRGAGYWLRFANWCRKTFNFFE
ncbi:hypothetical protein V7S43_014211 [Phytophthora oleae]|uniref:Uncharacterized protein n=1 Tax=Phytophthora oleae TaxID=2107226 RepID=A0ABD3F5S4_9STRA